MTYAVAPQRIAALSAILANFPGHDGNAQQQRILTAIEQLGSVTTFEAMRFLDCYDPRPRKLELCRKGHPIQLAWDRMETESGAVHRVGRYYMARQKTKELTE
jgi:hypothetical protein